MSSLKSKNIIEFFDVSVIIPCSGDEGKLIKRMALNRIYFQRNGIEVIIVADENNKEVSNLPDELPFINWKLVVIPGDTECTISRKFNAGLQLASHQYILFLDPGTVFQSDFIYPLRSLLAYHSNSFATIPVCCPQDGNIPPANMTEILRAEDNCALMAERTAIQMAGGFSHFDDLRLNNVSLQRRLNLAGMKKMVVSAAIEYEVCFQNGRDNLPDGKEQDIIHPSLYEILYPGYLWPDDKVSADTRVIFDWARHKNKSASNLVLEQFERIALINRDIFDQEYGIICLIQTHNESHNIPNALSQLDTICDGIILLDDGSSDGTYEIADSGKLLLKVQKTRGGIFNDLQNRNLLLQLGYLFNTEWFFFMDADERFDLRYADLRMVGKQDNIDSVSFRLIHIWNTKGEYRKDLPEGRNGVLRRYRMFRNKGYMQISAGRELHFPATPFRRNKYHSSILLLHYGLMDESVRQRKREAYLLQDSGGRKQGYQYDYLSDINPDLGNPLDLNFD